MKRLKPILLESGNGSFQLKAINYNITILQESNIEDVAKYDIILVDKNRNFEQKVSSHRKPILQI
jgi:hypothetical protein